MAYKYKHIDDIEEFKKNISQYNPNDIPSLLTDINNDRNYTENELYKLRVIINEYTRNNFTDIYQKNNEYSSIKRINSANQKNNVQKKLNREDVIRQEKIEKPQNENKDILDNKAKENVKAEGKKAESNNDEIMKILDELDKSGPKDSSKNDEKTDEEKRKELNDILNSISPRNEDECIDDEKTKELNKILKDTEHNANSIIVGSEEIAKILDGKKTATEVLKEKAKQEVSENANQKLREKAEIEANKRKKKSLILRIGAAIAAGVTAVTLGIGALWNRIKNDKVQKLPPAQVSDEKVPGTTEKNENISNINNQEKKQINDSITRQVEEQFENQQKVMEHINKFREDLKVPDEQSKQVREENEKINEEKALEEFELGSAMKLPAGTKYRESIFDGKEGEIGNSASPADGIYIINRYAEISENQVSNNYGLEGKIEKSNKDSNLFVHIAYVPGAKTEEEAKKILENSKDKKEYDRGWMKMADLQKAVEKQKQQESQNQR